MDLAGVIFAGLSMLVTVVSVTLAFLSHRRAGRAEASSKRADQRAKAADERAKAADERAQEAASRAARIEALGEIADTVDQISLDHAGRCDVQERLVGCRTQLHRTKPNDPTLDAAIDSGAQILKGNEKMQAQLRRIADDVVAGSIDSTEALQEVRMSRVTLAENRLMTVDARSGVKSMEQTLGLT